MVYREVPFVGNSSLLYSWANLNQFFKAYGLKSPNDFDVFWKSNLGTLEFDEDYPKIIMFGLNRKDNPSSIDEASELMYQYLEEHSFQDLQELIVGAQLSALVNTESEGEAKGETVKPPQRSKK